MTTALEGLRVLDLGRLGPSAMASMYLADFGAEVTSISAAPAGPDPGSDADIWSFDAQMHLIARALNRNKHSLVLNLRDPGDRDIFLALAAEADVVIEDFRPGTAQRLGIGYETLRKVNDRLVYCALSGYGQSSPMGDQGGHDLNFIAKAGLLDLIGTGEDAPPVIPLFFLSDFGGAALHAVSGILLALLARDRVGTGQFVDISFLDTALGLANPLAFHLLNGGADLRRGKLLYSGCYPHYALYRASDGRYVAVASFEPWLWKRFCAEIGLPDHGDADLLDAATTERVKADVAAVLATRTADYWEETLGPKSVCVTAVQSLAAMLGSDHAGARGMVAETRHDVYGTERHLANPIALSLTPTAVRRAAPVPGEDDHTQSQALREDTAT
ncbi:CoA transferase [Stappia stellulata]|uniref:CaiB/BaiF CoA transferase family protein n=1 Tax=Stappia stellulata TaxID=71235 RepID=UPI001CD5EA86|nr:CoA transferase [Stappia stellulata]MCA1243318.1 CoA transferase [Stappia stellulata]